MSKSGQSCSVVGVKQTSGDEHKGVLNRPLAGCLECHLELFQDEQGRPHGSATQMRIDRRMVDHGELVHHHLYWGTPSFIMGHGHDTQVGNG